ncbi:cytochrome b5 domain-containing protein [bacterium]|nr:cytochrome b5 domain-containing protein [bacterium]NBX98144.1 cytochrome b5 domain-containing protein [bacterium]NDC94852.1 cytochrome b5 domain-containing protein [bacterium]NDD83367.1 cytochrome b5 domain-containing protein [bacterium]NDG28945.1 cytochrome b5 domain-containing protein [bacterium]
MKKILTIITVIAVVIVAGLFFLKNNSASGPTEITTNNQASTPTNSSSTESTPPKSTYSKADVATHNNKTDCWTIINGSVYDITSYVPIHPGGVAEITRACGKDGTSLFTSNPKHNSRANMELANLKIGSLN